MTCAGNSTKQQCTIVITHSNSYVPPCEHLSLTVELSPHCSNTAFLHRPGSAPAERVWLVQREAARLCLRRQLQRPVQRVQQLAAHKQRVREGLRGTLACSALRPRPCYPDSCIINAWR